MPTNFGVGNTGFALAVDPTRPSFGGGPAVALPAGIGIGIGFGSRFRTACFHISCTAWQKKETVNLNL